MKVTRIIPLMRDFSTNIKFKTIFFTSIERSHQDLLYHNISNCYSIFLIAYNILY